MIILKTNQGNIVIKLNYDKAPLSCNNFTKYAKDGFYVNTIFHRVIKDFMIQGGGLDKNMIEKDTNEPIKNEANNGLKNDKYSIAMARTNLPHSATAQFFINTDDNSFLNYPADDNWGYCVFGEVVDGFAIIDKINKVKTTRVKGHSDVPKDNIIINEVIVE